MLFALTKRLRFFFTSLQHFTVFIDFQATLEFQLGKGQKKKHATTGVIRKESQRKGKPNVTCNKGKSKRTSNEEKEPLESNTEITEEKDNHPSGQFICSPTDSLEESVASFQETLQSTRFVDFTINVKKWQAH